MKFIGLSEMAYLPNGEQIKENNRPLSVRDLAVTACLNVIEGDDKMSAIDKIELGNLAHLLYESETEAEISLEMAGKLKARAARMFPVGVFWAFNNFIEPKPTKKE